MSTVPTRVCRWERLILPDLWSEARILAMNEVEGLTLRKL